MHLVCFGVMRRLLTCWLSSPVHKDYRISVNSKEKISDMLQQYGAFLPSDFKRRGRGLNDEDRWKATELRTFFYLGPIV